MRNNYSSLMDGGQITAPRFALFNPRTGQFDVENIGVAPDIEVDLDPAAWRQGHDPQLEGGRLRRSHRTQRASGAADQAPELPVYDWQKIGSATTKG